MSIRPRTVAGLAVAVTAAVALGAGTSVARTQAHRGAAPAARLKTTIHGVNFQVKSFDDMTFCMQVEPGVLPGRTITLQQCGVADNQRWAFSLNKGTTNLILDSQGLCIDGRFQPGDEGVARPVNACQFSPRVEVRLSGELADRGHREREVPVRSRRGREHPGVTRRLRPDQGGPALARDALTASRGPRAPGRRTA
jgi:hypothetical protein